MARGRMSTLSGDVLRAPKRNWHPTVAAALSLFGLVGLGEAYNGTLARGLRLLVISIVVLLVPVTAASLDWGGALFGKVWLGMIVGGRGAFGIYSSYRAWRDARSSSERPDWGRVVGGCLMLVLSGLGLLFAIRMFVAQAFRMPSGSMSPTLEVEDHFLVNKIVLGPRVEVPGSEWTSRLPGLRAPRRGDVVVFVWPRDRSKDFVKRIVALEGETIELRQNHVYVNGELSDDPHARFRSDPS